MLQEELNRICSDLSLETPSPDAEADFLLSLPDGSTLKLREDKKYITLHSPISGPLNESEDSRKLIVKALQIHWTRLQARPEILAFDPALKCLVLFSTIRFEDLSETPLKTCIENFLASLEFWKAALPNDSDSSRGQTRLSV